jgi:CHAT domain-containing protein
MLYEVQMNNVFKSSIVTILILFLNGGCASLFHEKERLAMGSQYSELERISEAENKDMSSAKSVDLIALCNAYSKLKKYNKLFSCLEQMENNIKKGDKIITHHGWFSWSYPENITVIPYLLEAEAHIDLGDYEKAVALTKKAYELLPTVEWSFKDRHNSWDHRSRIRSLGILALAYALKGDYKNALQYVVQLENESMGFWGIMNTPGAVTLAIKKEKSFGLARVYMALGRYDKILSDRGGVVDALGSFSEGYVGVTFFAFVDLPKEFIINKALYETGHIKEAKKGYDRLLSKPETKSNGEIYWPILFDRGRIFQGEGNTKQAVDFYKQSIDVIENQRSTIHTEASKIGFVGNKQKAYQQAISALFSDGRHAEAFEYVERSKARALVDMLASKNDFAVKTGNERVIHDLLARNTSAESELLVQGASADKSGMRSIVIRNKEKLIDQSPELASLVSVTSITLPDIQSIIPKEETLIEYYYADADLFAFILSTGGLKVARLKSDNLARDIQQLRKALEQPSSSDFIEQSQRLYEKLIKPLENDLANRNLIIVPHGALHYLPFNALHDGKGYLIERYSIRILPSASVITFLRTKKSAQRADILVFGNPDLGDPRFDLVYAQNEALAVAKTLPQSKVFLRSKATETAFKKYAGGFKYIHFATHGQFNPDAPLKSALWLSRDTENDGMLTVDKLYSVKLDADLVTLSACETGLGKIANGDDIVGLTRGFLYAGSSSIVASLWKVDDLATSQLMTRFYTELGKTNKRDSLRKAQLETKKKYAHPYYWAAFQLTGSAN